MTDWVAKSIAIASDHAGFPLKEELKGVLEGWGIAVTDLGTYDTASIDYPDYAHKLCKAVLAGEAPLGILVCGTGIGMSMAANRHAGIRAALCTDPYQAKMTRLHNDANVLCLGARVLGGGLAEDTVRAFLTHAFEGGRHGRRVEKIEPSAS